MLQALIMKEVCFVIGLVLLGACSCTVVGSELAQPPSPVLLRLVLGQLRAALTPAQNATGQKTVLQKEGSAEG